MRRDIRYGVEYVSVIRGCFYGIYHEDGTLIHAGELKELGWPMGCNNSNSFR